MANTLTGLIQTIYTSLDVVSRELTGLLPQVNRDARTEQAALNQTVSYPETEESTSGSVSPSMTIPEGTAQTIGANTLTISKSESVKIPWNGEEIKSLANGGIYSTIQSDQIQQAFRTLANEMEQDLLNAGAAAASRAVGTGAVAPFATGGDLSDLADLEVILDDNGAPGKRSLVMTSRGYGGLRGNMTNLFKVNESGDSTFLRTDAMGSVYNFSLGKTGAKLSHTKGGGSSYVTNGAVAVSDKTIAIDTGSGTVLTGDIVTFAGDTNKYVVLTGATAPGNIVINKPGAVAIVADGVAMTIGATYTLAGLAFSRDALILATRMPAMPEGGDAAIDEMMVTDHASGISFRVALYGGYHKQMIEVGAAWGVKAIKPAHMALLLG